MISFHGAGLSIGPEMDMAADADEEVCFLSPVFLFLISSYCLLYRSGNSLSLSLSLAKF